MSKEQKDSTHDQTSRAFENLQNHNFASDITKVAIYRCMCNESRVGVSFPSSLPATKTDHKSVLSLTKEYLYYLHQAGAYCNKSWLVLFQTYASSQPGFRGLQIATR